jgi:hypothetical protein
MGFWQNAQDLSEVLLQGPVTAINSVIVNGAYLNPSDYTLYDGRRLVRNLDQTGSTSSSWPWNQNLALPLTESGTFAIDYSYGRVPPPMARLACIELAVELSRALSGEDNTRLPQRVLSIATEGISVAVGDAMTYVRDSLIGIPICDLFLNQVNPNKLRRRSIILAPNTIQTREMQYGPP